MLTTIHLTSVSRMSRRLGSVVAVVLATQGLIASAVAQPVPRHVEQRLILGDNEKCAPFVALHSRIPRGSSEVPWTRSPESYRNGSPLLEHLAQASSSIDPAVSFAFRKRRDVTSHSSGETFSLSVVGRAQRRLMPDSHSRYPLPRECRQPLKDADWCELDEAVLMTEYHLVGIHGQKTTINNEFEIISGNSYVIYKVSDKLLVSIFPFSTSFRNRTFGLFLRDPALLVSGYGDRIVDFVCAIIHQ